MNARYTLAALLVFAGLSAFAPLAAQDIERLEARPPSQLTGSRLLLPLHLSLNGSDRAPDTLPTVAELYRRHAAVLEAQANEDHILVEARLGAIVRDLHALVTRPEYLEDERFAELYQAVLNEHERFFGPDDERLASPAEVFAVREQTFAALNELEDPLETPVEGAVLPTPASVAPTQVPMTINRAATTAMQVLLEKRPKTLQAWAERAHTWFPMIERIFAEEGVPDELKYLAMIESGLRPSVRSRAAAVGMWQFVAATGRAYDLVIDGWVDERMDPEKATRAAAKHLKDLYEREGDWHIALAGYNCSPRCLNRAKRNARAQGVENPTFWDMYRYLPRETRNYIPQYIATSIMLSNPSAYGIEPEAPGLPFAYELVPVRGSLALRDIAAMAGTTTQDLAALNPAIRRGYLPPSAKPYPLRLPVGTSQAFLTAYAELPADALRPPGEHIVRRGDTLSEIAATYGVSVSRLRSDNRIRGSIIRPGQRLIVPTSEYALPIAEAVVEAEPLSVAYEAIQLRPIHSLTPIELADRDAIPAMQQSTPTRQPTQPAGKRVTYTVRQGDTLSEIAEAHGVGLSRVRAWNNLRGSRIRTGSRLVLYVADDFQGPAAASRGATTYRVKSGDTLSEIARANNVSVANLRAWNGISGSRIRSGQTLRLHPPATRSTYTVRTGDTLTSIARRHNVSISDLRRWNALSSDRIYPGRTLVVAEGQ
ncbi:MAG: LysM peptidoglycan-binding domain-containing protein [Rhodothermales bacterium]|nr:LysM peptidoglycan-binding domain-containing protein [Rhodothermales bacterium]MBO6779541.1 LysM peptidoglycan-binding domain-containing protein [Rhodothermales bacterium]